MYIVSLYGTLFTQKVTTGNTMSLPLCSLWRSKLCCDLFLSTPSTWPTGRHASVVLSLFLSVSLCLYLILPLLLPLRSCGQNPPLTNWKRLRNALAQCDDVDVDIDVGARGFAQFVWLLYVRRGYLGVIVSGIFDFRHKLQQLQRENS